VCLIIDNVQHVPPFQSSHKKNEGINCCQNEAPKSGDSKSPKPDWQFKSKGNACKSLEKNKGSVAHQPQVASRPHFIPIFIEFKVPSNASQSDGSVWNGNKKYVDKIPVVIDNINDICSFKIILVIFWESFVHIIPLEIIVIIIWIVVVILVIVVFWLVFVIVIAITVNVPVIH
jgi:hypothetical protein